MAYNPAGVFTLIASYFAEPGTTIRTEQHNAPLEDIAAGLSMALVRDGRAPMVGPLNMNGFAITGVSPGSTPSSVATVSQAMPIGAVIDFAGANAPAGWMLCYGQAINRSTYAALYAIIGTTYGVGDGSTTFNLPDLRGRVVAGKDDMGGGAVGRLSSTYFGANPTVLGAAGGVQSRYLVTANLPPYTPSGYNGASSGSASYSGYVLPLGSGGSVSPQRVGNNNSAYYAPTIYNGSWTYASALNVSVGAASWNGYAQGGTSTAFGIVPPTLIMNKIIRVSYDG